MRGLRFDTLRAGYSLAAFDPATATSCATTGQSLRPSMLGRHRYRDVVKVWMDIWMTMVIMVK